VHGFLFRHCFHCHEIFGEDIHVGTTVTGESQGILTEITHALCCLSVITYIRHALWDFLPRMTTLFTDTGMLQIVNGGIKLLNVETKGTNNEHTGDFVEHRGLFFRNVARF
jgi:hypothetical protein